MRAISRVAINAGSSYGAMGLTVVINILLIPYVIGVLGKEVFGIVALIQSFQFIVSMAGSGLKQAFVRLYALHYAKSDQAQLSAYYSNAVFITLFMIAPAAFGVISLLAVILVPKFNIAPEMLFSAQVLMVILGIYTMFNFLSTPHMAVFASTQKFYVLNLWEIIYHVVFAACTLIFLWLWPSIIAYGLAYLAARLVMFVGVYLSAKTVLPCCIYRYSLVEKSKIRAVFSFSIYVLIPNLSANIYTHINQMIINAFLGPLYNTYFAVCLIWHRMVARILSTVGTVMAPQITTYQAQGQWRQIGEGLLRATKYSFLIGLPVGGVLAIIPGPVFAVWLGPGYEISAQAMFWIALAMPWLSAQTPAVSILIALGKVRFPSILAPCVAVLNLSIVLIGVKWFDFGIVRIASVLFVCMFLRLGLILPVYSAIQCKISYRRYIVQAYCRGLAAFLPAGLFLFFMKDMIDKWTIVNLFGILVITGLIYVIFLWLIALDSWDRHLFISYTSKLKYIKNILNK